MPGGSKDDKPIDVHGLHIDEKTVGAMFEFLGKHFDMPEKAMMFMGFFIGYMGARGMKKHGWTEKTLEDMTKILMDLHKMGFGIGKEDNDAEAAEGK